MTKLRILALLLLAANISFAENEKKQKSESKILEEINQSIDKKEKQDFKEKLDEPLKLDLNQDIPEKKEEKPTPPLEINQPKVNPRASDRALENVQNTHDPSQIHKRNIRELSSNASDLEYWNSKQKKK